MKYQGKTQKCKMPYDQNYRERADLYLGNLIPREIRPVLKKIKGPCQGPVRPFPFASFVPVSSLCPFCRPSRGTVIVELGSMAKGDAVRGEDRSGGDLTRRR
jgi:hypothetical protein